MDKPLILIVDDKKENLFALEEILDDLIIDTEIVTASSGNEAVTKCLEKEFALILMDVQMPGMDGFEAMNFIHRDSMNKDTPVIFLSAIYSDDSYKIKGIREGAVDFIAKPIAEGILIGKVNIFLLMYQQKHHMINQMNEITMLNRDMENFNRILAHDMKQPLNVIEGTTSFILSEDETLSPETKNLLGMVQKNCVNMTKLINEVLELLRTKSAAPEFSECHPTKIIETIKETIIIPDNRKINLKVPEIPPIITQPSLLSSIFRNLIGNSIKYNESEEINISINFRKEDDQYIFCIQDNGIGIPANKFDEVFQPFKRAHEGKKYSGTGVGLSIVQTAIEKLEGKIKIEHSDSNGTLICFRLPVR